MTVWNPEAELRRYRAIFWEIYIEAGEDPDGLKEAPPPGCWTPDVPELALEAVKELRKDYRDALEERYP